jgi:hypothetical protein
VSNGDNGLDQWARERSESVANDNAAAATSDNLSANLDNPQDPAYGGGGGYSLNVDPAFLAPGDLWVSSASMLPGSLWSPYYSMYPGQLFGYIFVPVYGRLPYRPYEPIRHGPYVPPSTHRPMTHAATTYVRRSVSTGIAVHPIGHR